MKARTLVALLLTALVCGWASDDPMDRATLRGLKSFKVVVDLPPGVEQAGITRSKLWAQVTQRLEKANIPVDPSAVEFIGVRVTLAHEKRTPYSVCISLAVYQNVVLAREAKIKTTTETWSGNSVLLAPPKTLNEAVLSTVDELAGQFVKAFQAANQ